MTVRPSALDQPRKWRNPRVVFVNSMSDLFHAKVPIGFVRDAFDVMRETPQHTYQILTKRSLRLSRMADKVEWPENHGEVSDQEMVLLVTAIAGCSPRSRPSWGSRLALRACCPQHLRSVRSSVRQLSRSSLRCQAGAFPFAAKTSNALAVLRKQVHASLCAEHHRNAVTRTCHYPTEPRPPLSARSSKLSLRRLRSGASHPRRALDAPNRAR